MTQEQLQDAYAQGFMAKCAEYGVDPRRLVKSARQNPRGSTADYFAAAERARAAHKQGNPALAKMILQQANARLLGVNRAGPAVYDVPNAAPRFNSFAASKAGRNGVPTLGDQVRAWSMQ